MDYRLFRGVALGLVTTMAMTFVGCQNSTTVPSTVQTTEQMEQTKESETERDRSKYDDDVIFMGIDTSSVSAYGFSDLIKRINAEETDCAYKYELIQTNFFTYREDVISGRYDICTVPAVAASSMYNSDDFDIQVLAVVNVGGLKVLGYDSSIKSLSDLKGKTIYAYGQGTQAEYILKYLLKDAGMDAEKDLNYTWCSEPQEIAVYLDSDHDAVAMSYEPDATALARGIDGLDVVLDLNTEYQKATGYEFPAVAVIAQNQFIEKHPDLLDQFMKDLKASVAVTNQDAEGVYQNLKANDVYVSSQEAIEHAGTTYIDGEACEEMMMNFLEDICEMNRFLIGTKVPEGTFIYKQ